MMDKIYIPPIKIQGIKTKIVPAIRRYATPEKDAFWIEPFMGSGVVGFNIEPEKAIFADLNPRLIDFYQQLQSGQINADIVKDFLEQEGEKLSRLDDEYYYQVRERFNSHGNPLDFLFLNRSCFNGMIRFNQKNEFNVPYGHKPKRFSKAYITKITNQIRHIERLLSRHDWIFVCQPFEKTLSESDLPENCFIYCDPPYIGRHVDYYDSWNEQDESLLRDCLLKSNQKFMLSTWDYNQYRKNQYVDTIWRFCDKINIQHFYHIGGKEKNRGAMTEALLTNYPIVK